VSDAAPLTMRDVVSRTGLPAGTLRMWETRHGFPEPQRLPSGHRRYSAADCEAIERVLAQRERGLSLRAAIDHVRTTPPELEPSLFAALRRARPELAPHVMTKRALVALSRAIEDEWFARAEPSRLFAAFQTAAFYRASAHRWRELARTADLAVAFADFERSRIAPHDVCEVPLAPDAPLRREWALVCEGERLAVAMTAWELAREGRVADADRRFETIWTVEPDAVRHVADAAAAMAAATEPALAGRLAERPAAPPPDLGSVMALVSRCIAYIAAAR
jgi:MerR family transcriptional regulator, light-induced transcriptional regulator